MRVFEGVRDAREGAVRVKEDIGAHEWLTTVHMLNAE